jgi:hypothetical protein
MIQTQNTGGKVDFAAVNSIDAGEVYEYVSGQPYPTGGHINCPRCGSRDNVSINRKTNHFHCFGCSGDGRGEISNIDYTAAALGCSPRDAAATLHNHFFVQVDGKPFTPPTRARIPAADSADTPTHGDTCTKKQDAEVNAFILECLRDANGDRLLINYLANRGLTPDICRLYDIYTISQTDYYRLNTKLKQRFGGDRLQGLPIVSPKCNFNFWGAYRIIFAVRDSRGRLQGFKARAIPGSPESGDGRKYRNATGRDGYNLAAAANPTNKRLFIVEGEFDAIAADAFGLSAVSFGGIKTTINGDTMRGLFPYCIKHGVNVSVCYDSDAAGEEGQRHFVENLKAAFPTLSVNGCKVAEIAADVCVDVDADAVATAKDFGDLLRLANGDKMTPSRREYIIKTVETFCTDGKHDINTIATITGLKPFEVRRGFMDMISIYGCYSLTFTDDYQYIKISY